MKTKTYEINGENFHDLHGFYREVSKILVPDENWEIGTLDGLNDALYGGFGLFDNVETVTFIWKNSEKSRADLGYEATKKFLETKLGNPVYSQQFLQKSLKDLETEKGQTLFETVIEIFAAHENVQMFLI